MKKIFIQVLFISGVAAGYAQQLSTVSQLGNVDYLYNPAVIDIRAYEYNAQVFDVSALYRHQWSSYDGAPRTAILSARYSNSDKKMTFNGLIAHDQFGLSKYTQVQAGYAYHLHFNREGTHGLSLGLFLSASQYRMDQTMIDVLEVNDPLLSGAIETGIFPSFGAGAFYFRKLEGYYKDGYLFGGISGEQVIPSDVRVEGSTGSQGNLERQPHLHALAGFRKYYGPKDYFEPIIRISKTFWSPTHIHGIVRATLMEQKVSLGIGFSSEYQFYLEAGFRVLRSVRIQYGLSSHLQQTLSRATGLSHQFVLSYQFLSDTY